MRLQTKISCTPFRRSLESYIDKRENENIDTSLSTWIHHDARTVRQSSFLLANAAWATGDPRFPPACRLPGIQVTPRPAPSQLKKLTVHCQRSWLTLSTFFGYSIFFVYSAYCSMAQSLGQILHPECWRSNTFCAQKLFLQFFLVPKSV